jgi:hypothetical protein
MQSVLLISFVLHSKISAQQKYHIHRLSFCFVVYIVSVFVVVDVDVFVGGSFIVFDVIVVNLVVVFVIVICVIVVSVYYYCCCQSVCYC